MREGYGSIGLYLGDEVRLRCNTYPDNPEAGPILIIDTLNVTFALSNGARGAVDAGDVDNARRLLEAVTTFAAEVERLYAANETAAGSSRDAAA